MRCSFSAVVDGSISLTASTMAVRTAGETLETDVLDVDGARKGIPTVANHDEHATDGFKVLGIGEPSSGTPTICR